MNSTEEFTIQPKLTVSLKEALTGVDVLIALGPELEWLSLAGKRRVEGGYARIHTFVGTPVWQFVTALNRSLNPSSAPINISPGGGKYNKESVTLTLRKYPHLLDCLYLLRSELEMLLDYDPKLLTFDMALAIKFLNVCLNWPHEKFVSFTKYHTACPMAAFLDNDLPSCPSTEFFPSRWSFLIWTGPLLRYLKNRIHSKNSKRSRFLCWSYLQGVKRGTKQVPEEYVEQSLQDHALALSTKPPKDSVIPPEWHGKMVEITMLVNDFFESQREKLERPLEPSNAASIQYLRSEGGAREYIRDLLQKEQGFPLRNLIYPDTKEDVNLIELSQVDPIEPELHSMVEVAPSRVQNVYSNAPRIRSMTHLESDTDTYFGRKRLVTDDDPEKSLLLTGFHGTAAVSAVLEPIKVRLITKASATDQYVSRRLQKTLWGTLSRLDQFKLTSRPLSKFDFYSLLDREKTVKMGGHYGSFHDYIEADDPLWVSGDYKAATDGLDIRVTKYIFEFILYTLDLTDLQKDIARLVLYEQNLKYPKKHSAAVADAMSAAGRVENRDYWWSSDGTHLLVRQRNGQLMGSVLSFPVLCIANLLCYWQALEEFTGTVISIEKLPVLINGDDILFRCCPEFYEVWLKHIKCAGFKLSVGKNYTHKNTFTINSQCFTAVRRYYPAFATYDHFTKVHRKFAAYTDYQFEETFFFNSGLLVDTKSLNMPLNQIYDKVVGSSMNPERTHRRFLHYHRLNIASATTGPNHKPGFYNLFLPPLLFGLDFHFPKIAKPWDGCERATISPWSITAQQAKLAKARQMILSQYSSPTHVAKKELNSILQQMSFTSDTVIPTYPTRHFNRYTFYMSVPTNVLNYEQDYVMPELKTPVLFEMSPSSSESPEFKVVPPSRSYVRRLLKNLPNCKRQYVPSELDYAIPVFRRLTYSGKALPYAFPSEQQMSYVIKRSSPSYFDPDGGIIIHHDEVIPLEYVSPVFQSYLEQITDDYAAEMLEKDQQRNHESTEQD